MTALPRMMLVVAVATIGMADTLAAQPRKAAAGSAGSGGQQAPRSREELEGRVRENFAAEVKKRLQLSDDQMTKVMAVNRRLDPERRELFQQERAARVALRAELQAGDTGADQARVAEVLDTLLRLQRRRLDLVEREQRELSAFLTPVQRARYQAFVDFIQRRMDDMADGRGRGAARRGVGPGNPASAGVPGRGGRRSPPPIPPPSR